MRKRLHAEVALNTAVEYGIFTGSMPQSTFLPTAEKALPEELKTFKVWEEQLKAACRRESEEGGPSLFQNVDNTETGSLCVAGWSELDAQYQDENIQKTTVHRPKRDLLKRDQRRAHDIIERQLLKRIAGKSASKKKN